jgi:hypothetical protein
VIHRAAGTNDIGLAVFRVNACFHLRKRSANVNARFFLRKR